MPANLEPIMSARKKTVAQISTLMQEDDLEERNTSQAYLFILAVLLIILFLAGAVLQAT